MIIDLRAEIEKRKITKQKQEALDILQKAQEEVNQLPTEECIIIYKQGEEYRYFANEGSAITFAGMLEMVKMRLINGL